MTSPSVPAAHAGILPAGAVIAIEVKICIEDFRPWRLEADIEPVVLRGQFLEEINGLGVFLVPEFGADAHGEDLFAGPVHLLYRGQELFFGHDLFPQRIWLAVAEEDYSLGVGVGAGGKDEFQHRLGRGVVVGIQAGDLFVEADFLLSETMLTSFPSKYPYL